MPNAMIPWNDLKQVVTIHQRAGLLPSRMTYEQTMVCLAQGHLLGINPYEAVRGIVVVDGKPTIMAGLLQAVTRRALPQYEVVLVAYERDKCTVKGRRHPNEEWTQVTYDMEDAKLAGLTGKQNWKKHPKQMLYARATTILNRMLAADVIHGLYTPDEMGLEEDPEDGVKTKMAPPSEAPVVELSPESEPEPEEEPAIETPFEETPPTTDPDPNREQALEDGVSDLQSRIASARDASESSEPTSTDSSSTASTSDADASESEPPKKEEEDPPKTRTRKKRSTKKASTKKGDDSIEKKYADLDFDALCDKATELEDWFTEGRDGDELTIALKARKAAQEASPNWDVTEDVDEIRVYVVNLAKAAVAFKADLKK